MKIRREGGRSHGKLFGLEWIPGKKRKKRKRTKKDKATQRERKRLAGRKKTKPSDSGNRTRGHQDSAPKPEGLTSWEYEQSISKLNFLNRTIALDPENREAIALRGACNMFLER